MHLFLRFTLVLLIVSPLGGCKHMGSPYELIAPLVQKDHELSEFGYGAVKETKDRSQWNQIEGSELDLHTPKPLLRGKRTYIILQIDGGGIMGIPPSFLAAELEKAFQSRPGRKDDRLCDILSMCSGTSTGAIITGGIAAGVPVPAIADFYYTKGYDLFQGKGKLPFGPVFQHVLSRKAFQTEMIETLEEHALYPPTVRLGEMDRVPILVFAAYDLVGKRTVFLRNQDHFDAPVNTQEIQLIDAISASALSAAVYFGKLVAPNVILRHVDADGKSYHRQGAVFADGGQGTQNTTIELSAVQALQFLKDDPEAQVALISLGCGNEYASRDFSKVLGYNGAAQVRDYLFRNQARSESILMQWLSAQRIEKLDQRLKVYRFDWEHDPKKASPFSINEEQREFLVDTAREMKDRPDFQQLLSDIADSRIPLAQFRE